MKIALIGKRRMLPSDREALMRLIGLLRAHGAELAAEPRYARILGPGMTAVDSPMGFDMVMSIGGDGTFLKAARWVAECQTPILGVNSGRLGYLTDMTLADAASEAGVERILGSQFIEPRSALSIDTPDMALPPEFCPFALNEVAVLRDESASMIMIHADIDGHTLATYPADGLIISTPTGSTGYNLSVGGPLVAPAAPCLVVAPVAAHTLTMRPLVVSDSSVLTLRVEARSPRFRLSLDGHSITLPLECSLRVRRAPFSVNIVRNTRTDFAETLRNKLLWGIDPR